MTLRKLFAKSSADGNDLVANWALRIFTCSFLLVLLSTLFPFNFFFPVSFSLPEIVSSFQNKSSLGDRIGNVLLFLPLGFGLTGLLKARWEAKVKLAIVLAVSAGLSSTVEFLQVFLPSRAPTFIDIMTNSIGGCFGFVFFHQWKKQIFTYALALRESSKKYLNLKKLIACFLGYMVVSLLLTLALLPSITSLENWDTTFPLLVNNEQTGNRPWQGSVSDIYIADRALSRKEVEQSLSDKRFFDAMGDSLLASYHAIAQGNYSDQTGHLPDLTWRTQIPVPQAEKDMPTHRWLETVTPTTFLTQRIRETSQFTLSTTVATADTTQTGPARIISLSKDTEHRNFTLGQQGNHLVFRMRTPVTGENGSNPELIAPNIFANTNSHHVVAIYSGAVLQVYVDNIQNLYSLEMVPIIAKILCYELIFIPLGFLLTLISNTVKQKNSYICLVGGGILLPPLILEAIFSSESQREMRLENLLLSILIMAGTILISKLQAPSWLKSHTVSP